MTKTITAGMRSHLDGTVTTLATLWEITRVDGVQFFFTDHDADIVYNSNTYKAATGYSRSAIANSDQLSVDNLDVTAVFDSADITEDDLRRGLFNFAEILVRVVNYEDLTDGDIKLRRGWFGESVARPQGYFETELRGMTQRLQQRVGRLYVPNCPVDLGSDECNVQGGLTPPLVKRSADYNADTPATAPDFVRVATTGTSFGLGLTNPGFDTGDLTGWTTVSGSPIVTTSVKQAGTHSLGLGITSSYTIEQVVDVTGSIDAADMDAGAYTIDVAGYMRQNPDASDVDTARHLWEALSSADVVLATIYDTGNVVSPLSTWTLRESLGVALPANTRKIRLTVVHTRNLISIMDVSSDSFSAFLLNTNEPWSSFEDRVYECTVAGTTAATEPTFNTGIGATTVDGSVTWTARDAFVRAGTVRAVTDNKTFTVDFAEARAVSDWFNGGAVKFLAGSTNNGVTREIRDSTYTGALIDATPTNAGFDTGDLTGWTENDTGAAVATSRGGLTPQAGSHFVHGGDSNPSAELEQDVTPAWSTTDVDAGLMRFSGTGYIGSDFADSDSARIRVQALDVSDVLISTIWDTGNVDATTDAWDLQSSGTVAIPANTRKLRWLLNFDRVSGSNLNADIDSLAGSVFSASPTGADDGADLVLFMPLPFTPAIGDDVYIFPGCDKRLATCRDKFDNVRNFRGFPHIPGNDAMTQYPDAR